MKNNNIRTKSKIGRKNKKENKIMINTTTCSISISLKYSCMLFMLCYFLYFSKTAAFVYRTRHSSPTSRMKAKQPIKQLQMISGSDLNIRIKNAVEIQYPGKADRVITCWENFVAGAKLSRYIDKDGKQECLQTADCFVDGLRAMPFHNTKDFPWIPALEENYKIILKELTEFENRRRGDTDPVGKDNLQELKPTGEGPEGDGLWLGPRDASGSDYGPEWKTLGLQDRSVWDQELAWKEFPQTTKIMVDNNVPSCECFFAKQGARSGLKPHSDKNNFIMTCHLALDVPEGECWIQVGNERYFWKNGETCVFDTSVIHSTENQSDRVRYVLLIRFWHPDLTDDEIQAFKLIFDYLDHAAMGDDQLEMFEMKKMLGKDNHAGLQVDNSGVSRNQIKVSKKSKSTDETLPGKSKKREKNSAPSKGFGKK